MTNQSPITAANFLCLLLLVFTCSCKREHLTAPVTYNLNSDWAFSRGEVNEGETMNLDDSNWISTTLPHTMQLETKHCGGDCIYDGIGWYRRYFKLPKEFENKRIALHFEGVMTNCELFINGTKVDEHHGGYVGFTTDISEWVKYDGTDNLIALRVSAEYDPLTPPGKPQANLDFYYFSGIYRDVTLKVSDKLHITDELEKGVVAGGGVFVTYPVVNKKEALIHIKTELANRHKTTRSGELLTNLIDAEGNVVSSQITTFSIQANESKDVSIQLMLDHPNLWHPYSPYLYTLESMVVSDSTLCDRRESRIGIRTIHYTTDEGFFINGEHLYLIGGNRHQGYPNIGDAAPNSIQEREVIDIKRGGYNAVRAAHYPQDPAFLDACDKYGLLVVECIPGWQYFNENPIFTNRLEEVCRDMIRRDRNRPSVILWETALNETHYPLEVVERIYNAAHEEYSGNQFYTAGDYYSHEKTEPYYDVFYKQVGNFPKDGSVMSNFIEDQIAIKPLFTREWGDGVGEKPRVSLAEDEYEKMKQARGRLKQLNGEGYFDWCMLDANPRMGGHFMWSYNDYTRGAEEETMYSGVVDLNRYPKYGYYMMQSMRSNSISQNGLYNGPMIFIASNNSAASYPTSTTDITIYSNCDSVTLHRNQLFIGGQSRETAALNYSHIVAKGGSPAYTFDAKVYEAGKLVANGYINGELAAKHEVQTPLEADQIVVEIPTYDIKPIADGSDLIPVYFKICDKNGTLVNHSNAEITIDVKGEGEVVGDNIERLSINPQRVEGGVGFVFVRTTKRAGKIRIIASASGLKDGEATTQSHCFEGRHLPVGRKKVFKGHEEDGVVVKPTKWERQILNRDKVEVEKVETTSTQTGYAESNIIDCDDFSWWIAGESSFPQTITITLKETTQVTASKIRFQKDSSKYSHKVEVSEDGKEWELLYERECTGWDFKPHRFEKSIKYFRVVINQTSEGRAGLAEITLFK